MQIKKIIYYLLYWSGFNYVYSIFASQKLYVVMYHSVRSRDPKLRIQDHLYTHISIDEDRFVEELEYLKKRGHTFITFSDLAHVTLSNINKPTILYFDDGFKDFLTVVYPILQRMNIKASIFPVSGILDRTDMIWTILCREAMIQEGKTEAEQHAYIEFIKSKTEKERIEIMSKYPLSKYQTLFDIFLTWDDITMLSAKGIEIGSHGVSHTKLDELSPQEVNHEIMYSKSKLEEHIKVVVRSFSFPHGRGNRDLVNLLQNAGYQYAVSEGIGLNDVKSTVSKDILYLRNISPKSNDSMMMFSLRMYILNLFK